MPRKEPTPPALSWKVLEREIIRLQRTLAWLEIQILSARRLTTNLVAPVAPI